MVYSQSHRNWCYAFSKVFVSARYRYLGIIKDYKVLITSSHPEYHSTKCWDTIYNYQLSGGNLIYLGGNGWYWRIVWHNKFPGIIEVRRAEDGVRSWEAEPGEYYHSFNGEYGGLWRRLGRAPNKLLGIGFSGQGFDVSSYYRRTKQSYLKEVDFIFKDIKEDILGDFGLVGGGAAGLELDRYDQSLGSPKNCYVLATSENHSDLYLGVTEEIGVNMPNQSGSQNPNVKADLVYFKKNSGSKKFNTSQAYEYKPPNLPSIFSFLPTKLKSLQGNPKRRPFIFPKSFFTFSSLFGFEKSSIFS